MALFESNLPIRWYLPREDVTAKLEPTYVDSDGNQYGEPGSLNRDG